MAEVKDNSSIQLFEDQKIRTAWDAEKEEWYFSIIDVISVLTGTANPRRYWSDLKRKLKAEGANELYEKIVQLKMLSSDGKRYKTDVANTEQLLRIIQSIPSPKAEPFKAWLAMVGKERIEETIDPEQAIDRALDTYLKKGYSEEWIHQRLLAIRIAQIEIGGVETAASLLITGLHLPGSTAVTVGSFLVSVVLATSPSKVVINQSLYEVHFAYDNSYYTHCYHDILYSYDSGGHLMDTTKSYHQAVGG